MWKDIKNAPKVIGHPLWVRGSNFGELSKGEHLLWAYWDGANWMWQGTEENKLEYLTHYLEI
jgi:hypothetical protein